MVCPFRLDIETQYAKVDGIVKPIAQRQIYPECNTFDCPFWDVTRCTRIDLLFDGLGEE